MSDNFSYLDILEKKLDKSQRAACCRNLNTVVAAGAGSGKTQVLATRFAWLVMSGGIKVDEILALTFTKKAASEIYQRIYKTLGQFASHKDTPPKEKERAKQALKDFNKAHIQTLDSYSSTVVRQAANRYGINPKFTASDVADIKAEAFRFLVNHKDEPALLAIAKPGKLQNLAQELFAYAIKEYTDITCSSTFFEEKLPIQCREIAAEWNKISGEDGNLSAILDEIKGEYYREENADKRKGEYFVKVKAFIDGEPELPKIEDISVFETDYESLYSQVSAISQWTELFVFSQSTAGWTKAFREINKRFKEIKTVFDSIASFILNYQHIKRIFELLDEFMEQINEEKRKSGSLSFGDINALALKILKEQKEIRNQEKKSFKKIMIDEFQDNNGKNRDMLYLLAEKDGAFTDPALNGKDFQEQLVQNLADDKLYFVGDEKQSIYKFRGADVSVFNSLTEDLALTVPPETETKLYMTNNYRSTEPVLAMFNRFFGDLGEGGELGFKVFGDSGDDVPAYEAYYTKPATYKDSAVDLQLTKANVPMHVSIFDTACIKEANIPSGKTEDDFLNGNDTVAYYTAKKIQEHFNSEKAKGNEPKYADYAVLCKSRNNYSKLVRWLNAFNIPYSFDQQKSVFEDGPINDIFNFLRLCTSPQDKTALAAYLCSPFAGLKIAAVEIILTLLPEAVVITDKETGKVRTFQYTAFSENQETEEKIKVELESVSVQEYQKYLDAKAFYLEMKNRVLTEPLTDTVTKLWYETGARYETLIDKTAEHSAEQYDLLFELVRKAESEGAGTAWIIDQLAKCKQNARLSFGGSEDELGIKDISYPVEKDDAVQIMTIHKSKGLEFEHVFILGCISSGGNETESLVFYDDDFGVSLKIGQQPNYFYQKQKDDSAQKEAAEYKRLLYVAVTRAKKDVFTVDSLDASAARTKSRFRDTVEYFYKDAINGNETDTEQPGTAQICYKERCPFDFELLERIESNIKVEAPESQKQLSLAELRAKAFEKLERLSADSEAGAASGGAGTITGAKIIRLDENIPQKRITPNELEKLHENEAVSEIPHEPPVSGSIESINTIINAKARAGADDSPLEENDSRIAAKEFSHEHFGTLAHAYLENAIKFGRAEIDFETKALLQKDLSDSNFEKLCGVCRDMTQFFLNSETGRAVTAAKKAGKFCKTEYAFKLLHDTFIIRGSIDLIFQDEQDKFVIVDYKTDQSIRPEIYYEQQSAYRFAAKEILGLKDEKESALKLFFLRYAQEVDITQKVDALELSGELMQKLL